jgi:hypothetical protein
VSFIHVGECTYQCVISRVGDPLVLGVP